MSSMISKQHDTEHSNAQDKADKYWNVLFRFRQLEWQKKVWTQCNNTSIKHFPTVNMKRVTPITAKEQLHIQNSFYRSIVRKLLNCGHTSFLTNSKTFPQFACFELMNKMATERRIAYLCTLKLYWDLTSTISVFHWIRGFPMIQLYTHA